RLYLYFGIDFRNAGCGSNCLWQAIFRIGFLKKRLTLQICIFNKVTIYDPKSPDSSTGKHLAMGGAKSAAAKNQDAGFGQALLSL
ncbi:hypothetical protein OFB80_32210, partial [Escherichia coli]|nr:hypothetical protein [Escherichia coli]